MAEKGPMFAPETLGFPPSRNNCPTTDQVRRDMPRNLGALTEDTEAVMIELLTRARMRGDDESHYRAAQHREQLLRDLFDQLSATQALTLARRLDADSDGDRVAVAFRRLTIERRRRLRAYLGDARRRLAISRPSCQPAARNEGDPA